MWSVVHYDLTFIFSQREYAVIQSHLENIVLMLCHMQVYEFKVSRKHGNTKRFAKLNIRH